MRTPNIRKDIAALPSPDKGDNQGSFQSDYDSLMDRYNSLQVAYDKTVDGVLSSIICHDPVDAQRLREIYDSKWFSQSMYSDDALMRVADKLLEVTDSISPGYALWVAMSDGVRPIAPEPESEDDDEGEPAPVDKGEGYYETRKLARLPSA